MTTFCVYYVHRPTGERMSDEVEADTAEHAAADVGARLNREHEITGVDPVVPADYFQNVRVRETFEQNL